VGTSELGGALARYRERLFYVVRTGASNARLYVAINYEAETAPGTQQIKLHGGASHELFFCLKI
jgi:hypothetical protein